MQELTWATAGVGAVALVAIAVALVALVRLRKARAEYVILRGERGDSDLLAAVSRAVREQGSINERLDALVSSQAELAGLGRLAIQRFGLVRYDAFDDMGGRMSFSAALIDDHGDGIIITSINGRTEARTYAKPVRNLRSEHNLSNEERAALDQAAGGRTPSGSRATVTLPP